MERIRSLVNEIHPPASRLLGNCVLAPPQQSQVQRFMWLGCLTGAPTGFSRAKLPSLDAIVKLADSKAWQFVLLTEVEDLPRGVKVDQQEIDVIAFCTFLAKFTSSGQTELVKSIMLDQTGAPIEAQNQFLSGARSEYQNLLAAQNPAHQDKREPFPAMTLLVNVRHPDF